MRGNSCRWGIGERKTGDYGRGGRKKLGTIKLCLLRRGNQVGSGFRRKREKQKEEEGAK